MNLSTSADRRRDVRKDFATCAEGLKSAPEAGLLRRVWGRFRHGVGRVCDPGECARVLGRSRPGSRLCGVSGLRPLLLCLLLAGACGSAWAQRGMPLEKLRGHLYGRAMLCDSIPVLTMLESGIPFPMIDSALVWAHPELFRPEPLGQPVRLRMAAGFVLTARYKLPAGLRVGAARSLCETYVADLGGGGRQLYWPLQTFTTDSLDLPGIFGLDIARGRLAMLTEADLPAPGGEWSAFDLRRDAQSGMYLAAGPVAFTDDEGGESEEELELIADLGNANLLALFVSKPRVRNFVARSDVRIENARSARGVRFDVLLPARTVFQDAFAFGPEAVLLLDRPVRLPGDGFLGIKFFERFRVILDFRRARLWLAPAAGE